jgi:hypothetical protein
MANYFNNFPTTYYTLSDTNSDLDVVTDVTKRIAFEQEFKKNSAAYIKYFVDDGDTPEIVAYKYYGDVEKHWIVLMMNDIIDPQYDWPLKESNVIKMMESKYSANASVGQTGVEWAKNNVQSYYKVETKTVVSTGQYYVDKVQVDANTYANISVSNITYTLEEGKQLNISTTKETKNYYDYEIDLNDSKRNVILLRGEFVPLAVRDLKTVFDMSN